MMVFMVTQEVCNIQPLIFTNQLVKLYFKFIVILLQVNVESVHMKQKRKAVVRFRSCRITSKI